MLQLNGTALPSLALENFQEIETLKSSGSERERAEETIAGALASIYAGQCHFQCLDLVEAIPYDSRRRYRKSVYLQTCMCVGA